ncbi:MAG: TIGR02391 family protein [Alphaproteobacteria bacterium]|nr:MAG: TIGR02391 family protein [Alphaproteobacteria bacterium]
MPEGPLNSAVLRGLCEVLGHTDNGLTNAQIERLLSQAGIVDPTPTGTPGLTYVAINKRDRLENALTQAQQTAGNADLVLRFIKLTLSPARFHGQPEARDALADAVNEVLSFAAFKVLEDGKLARVKKASTLSEAAQRARKLKHKLEERGTHPRLLAACVREIEDNNYFHAVLEAAKSMTSEIVRRTGATGDGHPLVAEVFESGQRGYPLLALTAGATPTERARQTGLANGLRSIYSSVRNPTAHEPRVTSEMTEQDALDAFAWMSFLHRRIDDCHDVKIPTN